MIIDHLTQCACSRLYQDGTVVCKEGDVGRSVSLLIRGRVSVIGSDRDNQRVLAELAPGELWGEMAYILGGLRTATIRAIGAVEVIEWQFSDIESMCENDTEVGMKVWRNLARILAERLSKSNDAMSR